MRASLKGRRSCCTIYLVKPHIAIFATRKFVFTETCQFLADRCFNTLDLSFCTGCRFIVELGYPIPNCNGFKLTDLGFYVFYTLSKMVFVF